MTLQQDFVENLRQIFPLLTSARLSRWTDVSARTCQRWLKGEEIGVPVELQERAVEQLALVEQSRISEKLGALVQQMTDLGLDPDVIISHLESEIANLDGH